MIFGFHGGARDSCLLHGFIRYGTWTRKQYTIGWLNDELSDNLSNLSHNNNKLKGVWCEKKNNLS